jgi:hypothetical protein
MKTLKSYVAKRKSSDPAFAKGYESGYGEFKIGVMLKVAREEACLSCETVV